MAHYVKDECPVCKHEKYRIFGKVREESPPLPVPEGSAIVACHHCKLIYVNPMPHWDKDDFSKLYNESYFLHLNDHAQTKWLALREKLIPQRRFERIEPHLQSDKKKLLEIGAGEFAFMCRHLAAKDWDVTAQEPSALFADKLNNIKGLKVTEADLLDLKGEGEYSLIFADSVLEHVPNPVQVYQKLAGLLAPGGVLYTVSPNEYSAYNFMLNFIAKRKKTTPHFIAPYTQPYHLTGFTKRALDILAHESGLILLNYRKIDDFMAFHALHSNRPALRKYPLSFLYAASQAVGFGTNGEALFVKR